MPAEAVVLISICLIALSAMTWAVLSVDRKKPQPRDSRGRFTKRKD